MNNLHLGCFDQAAEGWVNTDITPHLYVARVPGAAWVLRRLGLMTRERYEQHRQGVFEDIRYVDLGKRFPFRDGEFDNAFSAHVVEHLYPDQAANCLREVHRVLKPGGVFRVTVPDLGEAVETFDPEQPEGLLELIYNADQKRDKNRHHWMYTEQSMGRALRAAGFSEVYRCAFGEGRCPDLERMDNRPEGTLFMEGVK